MTDVNVLRMEDGRVKARLIGKSTRIASWIQMRKEILEITRTQQYADSNLVTMQIGVQPKSKGRGKDGKEARNESSEKVKHTRSQSRTGQKDLACAEGKPVTANSRLSSAAAVSPLAEDHVATFLVTAPHVKRKSSCACVKIETTMRSDPGSTAPTTSERVKNMSAIPMCETRLTIDTVRAEASVQEDLIKPHRRTQRWQQHNSW